MRVGLVLHEFDPCRGGLEQWTWQFGLELLRRGHELHVIAKRFTDQMGRLPITAHHVEPVRSKVGYGQAVREKLASLDLHLIHDMGAGWHCNVFQPHGGSWLSVTERKLNTWAPWSRPLKRQVDRVLPRQREFRQLLQRQYADHGQVIVALSHTVAEDLERFHNVHPDRIRIVYNGVDTNRFSPSRREQYRQTLRQRLGLADTTTLLLIVAHNFTLKGVPTLLRALKKLTRNGKQVHLAVVGGKRLKRWRQKASRIGVDAAVTFIGTTEDTVPYYAAADVYVHPTFYDTCSLVVLEAAASGLPIVTTKQCNGVSELLRDEVDAFLVEDPTNAHDVAERIEFLMDGSVRRPMGEAARRMALRHTFDRNVDEMLAVYSETQQWRHAA